MRDNSIARLAVCPLCGKAYHCGTRQALASIGVEPSEQEQILETIHRHTQG